MVFITWIFEKILDVIAALVSYILAFLFGLIAKSLSLSTKFDGPGSTLYEMFNALPALNAGFKWMIWFAQALVLLIAMFQIFAFYWRNERESELPLVVAIRAFVTLVAVASSKLICSLFFYVGSIPYNLFINLKSEKPKINIAQMISDRISGPNAIMGAIEDVSGLAVTANAALMFIMLIVLIAISIEFFKLTIEMFERYVVLGALSFFSPVILATGVSKRTNRIANTWVAMMVSQCTMMVVNVIFIRAFIDGFGKLGVQGLDGGAFVVRILILLAWLVTGQRADAHLQMLGLATAQTGMLSNSIMSAYNNHGELAARTTNSVFGMAAKTKLGQALGVQNPYLTTNRTMFGKGVEGAKNGEKYSHPFNLFARNNPNRAMAQALAGKGTPPIEMSSINKARRTVAGNKALLGGLREIYNGNVGADAKSKKTAENGTAILSGFKGDANIEKLKKGFNLKSGMASAGAYELSGTDKKGNAVTASLKAVKDAQHTIPVTDAQGNTMYMGLMQAKGVNSPLVKSFMGEGNMNAAQSMGALAKGTEFKEARNQINPNAVTGALSDRSALTNSGGMVQMKDGSLRAVQSFPNGEHRRYDAKGKEVATGEYRKDNQGNLIHKDDLKASGALVSNFRGNANLASGTKAYLENGKEHTSLTNKLSSGGAINLETSGERAVGYKRAANGEFVKAENPGEATHFRAIADNGQSGFVSRDSLSKEGILTTNTGLVNDLGTPTFPMEAGTKMQFEMSDGGSLQGYRQEHGLMRPADRSVATHYREAGTENFIPKQSVGFSAAYSGGAITESGAPALNFGKDGTAAVIKQADRGYAPEYTIGRDGVPVAARTHQGTHILAADSEGNRAYVPKTSLSSAGYIDGPTQAFTPKGEANPAFEESLQKYGGNVNLTLGSRGEPTRYKQIKTGEFMIHDDGEFMQATTMDGRSGFVKIAGSDNYAFGLSDGAIYSQTNADGKQEYFRDNGFGQVRSTTNFAEAYASTPIESGTIMNDTKQGAFALGSGSFDQYGNLKIGMDKNGVEYITDSTGRPHALSSIETNSVGGYATYNGGNEGAYVKTENGMAYLKGGVSENYAGVQTYNFDEKGQSFVRAEGETGTHVYVAGHSGSHYEKLADGERNASGFIKTYDYQSDLPMNRVNFTATAVNDEPITTTRSYMQSDNGDYYRDRSGKYREVSNLYKDDEGSYVRYDRNADGKYVESATGAYVREIHDNQDGQRYSSYVETDGFKTYNASLFASNIPVDSQGNVSIPATAEFKNVDKGIYTAKYDDGREVMFVNTDAYGQSSRFNPNDSIKVEIDGQQFYAMDVSPVGHGLQPRADHYDSSDYMDLNQFAGAKMSHRTESGGIRTDNYATIDSSRADKGLLRVEYNIPDLKDTQSDGAVLFSTRMYEKPKNASSHIVTSRDGQEFYAVETVGGETPPDMKVKTLGFGSMTSYAKSQFYDKSYIQGSTEIPVTKSSKSAGSGNRRPHYDSSESRGPKVTDQDPDFYEMPDDHFW